jgi:hypothetical protein
MSNKRRGISRMSNYNRDDYIIPRQRPIYERLHVPMERSQPPLRAWGPHVLAALLGIALLVLLTFTAKMITIL